DAGVGPDAGPDAAPDAALDPDAAVDLCLLRDTMEPVVLYLSADDSNSMASAAIARNEIRAGRRPAPGVLRTYEFLNYYNVPYEAPAQGRANVIAELREGLEPGEYVMQLGVQSAPLPAQHRSKVLTLVLDTSGSMGGSPIELEREAVRAIAASLRAGDIVSFVEWNTTRTVPLEAHIATGPNDPTILAAANAIRSGGGTNLHGGLTHGYALARAHYDPSRLNRVVLISDGQANAGILDRDIIAAAAEDSELDGIYLVGVGVGDGIDDTLMDAVTDAGRGAYVFIDSAAEARRLFVDRFDEVMEISLMAVQVQLQMPWYMAVREFHGEEISTDPKEVTPQHLAPGDAMVFHQIVAACDPALVDPADGIQVTASYVRPEGRVPDFDVMDTTFEALLSQPDIGLRRGDAIVAYAEFLKQAPSLAPAEGLAAREGALSMLREALAAGPDADLEEIESLLLAYPL
ncbi:MAG: VWA domain-containing protein, partial [Myxococcales bacterium]|nr:VWA domain-containing protein [Myxococcales bacterium]